jgi:hypothetical protein
MDVAAKMNVEMRSIDVFIEFSLIAKWREMGLIYCNIAVAFNMFHGAVIANGA